MTSPTTMRPDNPTPNTSFLTFDGETTSPLSHMGTPNQPIVIVDEDTTPPSSKSSSASSSKKRKGSPIHRPTSRYVRQMTTGLPNLGSSVWKGGNVMILLSYHHTDYFFFSTQSACFLLHFSLSLRIAPSMHS